MAHQLTNVLFLTPKSAVGFNLSSFDDGLEEVFFERQRFQFGHFQRKEIFAHFLQRNVLAFSRAFTGL